MNVPWSHSLAALCLSRVPRMAKTFDNISESSATNYLFLFAQRTLALQNEPPTPPPLNALGLPCNAISLLWTWLKEKAAVKQKPAGEAGEVAAAGEETSETMEVSSAKLKGTVAKAAADKARLSTGPVSSKEVETAPVVLEEAVAVEAVTVEAAAGAAGVGASLEEEEEAGEINVATDNFHADDTSVDFEGGAKEQMKAAPETPEALEAAPDAKAAAETETPVLPEVAEAAEMIDPLAKKITEYILDHQDDAAQEDRWRTTMKRETMKCFREQREASKKSFHAQREESGNQRVALDSRFDRQREEVQKVETEVQTVKAEVQKIEAGVQKVEMKMQQRFDEVHSKIDEKMDQLVKNIADLVKQH